MQNKSHSCGGCNHCSSTNSNTSIHSDTCLTSSETCSCPMKNALGFSIRFDDDVSHNCRLLATIEVNNQEYVILEHPTQKVQLLYRYTINNDNISLDVIEGKEFDIIAKAYESMA